MAHAHGVPQYRAEIDGLRALAVIPVILYHAGFATFGGGFVGVDVFFVISGYLITTIIHDKLEAGSFSLIEFYERRIRRILPALMVVSIACVPFAWRWMLPGEFKDFAQSLVAVNVFASNILFWKETGYFSPDVQLKPLLHTWSLAVEEQYYLTFPLLLMLLRRLRRRALIAVLLLLTVASLALAHWTSTRYPAAAFYLLPTRAWELGVGALLAVTASAWGRTSGWIGQQGWRPQVCAAGGLVMIAGAVAAFDSAVPYPSLWTLLPVLGAAGVIVFAGPDTLVGRLLGWRPIVGVGLISYSAYLWHQPLFAFARLRCNECAIGQLGYLELIALTFALAYLTWRFIEQPFRLKMKAPRIRTLIVGTATATALVALSVQLSTMDQAGRRLKPGVLEMAAWSNDYSPYRWRCHGPRDPAEACIYGASQAEALHVWGDSHGVELAWRLAERFDIPIKHLTHPDCVPSLGVHSPRQASRDSCVAFNRAVFDYFRSLEPGARVLMIARWPESLEVGEFDNGEGGIETRTYERAFAPLDRGAEFLDDASRPAAVGILYRSTVEELLALGHQVILVYPIPEVGWNVPLHLARKTLFGQGGSAPLSTSFAVFQRRTRSSYEQLDRIPDHPNLIRVRPAEAFCDTFVADRCVAELDGKPLYFDNNHPNSLGADLIAELVVDAMVAAQPAEY